MNKEEFIQRLQEEVVGYENQISQSDGSWVVKGFIDTHKHIYSISTDTKVVSKILELYLFPKIMAFAEKNHLKIELTKEQNFYPDITFKDMDNNLFAVDLKSSYRKNSFTINGLTLGAFTGYFRDRKSTKNTTHPYGEYKAHIVLGVLYSTIKNVDECHCYTLDELKNITSVIKNFQFFVQEKWRIAKDVPGSGNTKNIGSVTGIQRLITGNGPFSLLGEEVFDDYWRGYLTKDMAKKAELEKPYYTNLEEYKQFKHLL